MKKLLLTLCTLTLSTAFAADNSFRFTLQEPATLNGTRLNPGDYRIEVNGEKATLKMGKTTIQAPAKLETAEQKFNTTTVDFENVNGNPAISEIHIGGTKTRIVFSGN